MDNNSDSDNDNSDNDNNTYLVECFREVQVDHINFVSVFQFDKNVVKELEKLGDSGSARTEAVLVLVHERVRLKMIDNVFPEDSLKYFGDVVGECNRSVVSRNAFFTPFECWGDDSCCLSFWEFACIKGESPDQIDWFGEVFCIELVEDGRDCIWARR